MKTAAERQRDQQEEAAAAAIGGRLGTSPDAHRHRQAVGKTLEQKRAQDRENQRASRRRKEDGRLRFWLVAEHVSFLLVAEGFDRGRDLKDPAQLSAGLDEFLVAYKRRVITDTPDVEIRRYLLESAMKVNKCPVA